MYGDVIEMEGLPRSISFTIDRGFIKEVFDSGLHYWIMEDPEEDDSAPFVKPDDEVDIKTGKLPKDSYYNGGLVTIKPDFWGYSIQGRSADGLLIVLPMEESTN